MIKLVTDVRPVDKKKSLVYLDDGEKIPLYNRELKLYRIAAGEEISGKVFSEITAVLKKRARLRCLHLLQKADKTESQLVQKLKEGGYPPFLIEDALEYVKSFHYVDDERYARLYVEQNGARKSRRQMKQELAGRGISADMIQLVLTEETVDEDEAARKLARKKIAAVQPQDAAGWQKIYRYLAGKGYSYETISRAVEQLREEWP